MSETSLSSRPVVGIDLAPVEQAQRAAGTARLVAEQGLALVRLDVPWDWAPLVQTRENPLWDAFARHTPIAGGSGKVSVRSTIWNGAQWARRGCALAFVPNGIVPFRGMPVVSNFFDASLYEFGSTWIRTGRLLSFLLLRALAQVTIRRSRRLFILSKYGREKMAALFPGHAAKFIVTPGGVSPLPPAPASPPAWATGLSGPFFLNVGVFSDNKNQARLIGAWAQLQADDPAAPALALVGAGDSAYLEATIWPALARLPRPAEVVLPGRVPDAELAWAYANARGYLQPSFAEGFGLPVVEAMSANCPVACSRSTSLPETAGDAALYFNPADPADIARAVRTLARDDALCRQLRDGGRARARHFTWEANAAVVAREITKVLVGLGSLPPGD